ncbi:MAG TPA: BatA domain-containing protein, partial [Chloroflexota bacterium]|nr:BatA domain-containing protein [Chloroflexota bacterium]
MLLGLLLLPTIVALHLRRRSIREIEVPSLILWEGLAASAGTGGKRWRVEHLVALVLQLAVAAMLALALARPSGLAGTASTRVYVLDAGILMTATDSAPSRMAVAQSEIAHDIESAPAGTTFTIVSAGPQPQVVVSTTDPATAVQRLHAIVPIAALPDLPRAVNLAAAFSPARHARLLLVYARGETAPATPAWLGAITRSVVGRSDDNQSIASLSVRCQA